MTKNVVLIMCGLFTCINSFAQTNAEKVLDIFRYAYQADSSAGKSNFFSITIDSICVDGEVYVNKIVTKNYFISSSSVLNISYYLKDDSLLLARINEQSPKFDDMFSTTELYFENSQAFSKDYHISIRPCMALSMDLSFFDMFGYNKYFTEEFINSYSYKLFDVVKTVPKPYVKN